MKERRKTLPPKLQRISQEISLALTEARKIEELSVQEEVLIELEKVNAALEQARREITRMLH